MCVWGHINGRPTKFLVDTGAQLCLMSEAMCRVVGAPVTEVTSPMLQADGSVVHASGKASIFLAVGRQGLQLDVRVMPTLAFPFILGVDLLTHLQGSVDVTGQQLVLGSEVIPFASTETGPTFNSWVTPTTDAAWFPGLNVVGVNTHIPAATVIVWPCRGLFKKGLFCEPSLVQTDDDGLASVLLINLTDGDVPPPTNLGWTENETAYGSPAFEIDWGDKRPTPKPVWLQQFRLKDTDLTDDQIRQVEELLLKYQDAISTNKEDLGYCATEHCTIDTGLAPPVRLRWRRLSPVKQQAVDREVASLKRRGLIVDSASPWAAPLVVVPKKSGEWRVCADYRLLNQLTKKDSYPMPDVARLLDELEGHSWFSTLDLTSGYLQVPMAAEDQEKTAFVTSSGLYEYRVMSFGLCNAPAQFSRIMARIFADAKDYAIVYMDDVLVKGKSFAEELQNLEKALQKLVSARLKVRPDKCKLFRREVNFLGHVVSGSGIAPDPSKTDAVANWPTPSDKGELSSFLGLCGYYQKFVPDYATIAKPLYNLQCKNAAWAWSADCGEAFQALKRALLSPPILAYPRFGEDRGQFILDVDASDVAAGAVLSQLQDGIERVVAYGHKSFNKSQRNYCATMKELLALVWFVVKYKELVWGCEVLVRTDHQALTWLRKNHSSDKMLGRWHLVLEDALDGIADVGSLLETLRWRVEHRPGRIHGNADALSRRCGKVKWNHADCPSCKTSEPNATLPTVSTIALAEGFSGLAEWQRQEPAWNDIMERLAAGEGRPNPDVSAGWSKPTQMLVRDWSLLCLHGGLLCRRNRMGEPRAVVPEPRWPTIIRLYHVTPGSAHEGASKLTARLSQKFYWFGMTESIKLYVHGCLVCQTEKSNSRIAREPLVPMAAGYPNQRVHLDFAGPFSETRSGHRFILIMVDAFSGFVAATPTKDTSTISTLEAFIKDWVTLFGLPDHVHADRGANFESELMALICNQFGVRQTRTCSYHPQGNGKAENAVAQVKRALRVHTAQWETTWDRALHWCLMTLRSGTHTRTGVSPALLFLGRPIRTIGDTITGVEADVLAGIQGSDYAQRLLGDLHQVHAAARLRAAEAKGTQKEIYDKGAYTEPLAVGSRVIKRIVANFGSGAKFTGPFIITELDFKKAKLRWEEDSSASVGWCSRNLLKLIGDNDAWSDKHGEVWMVDHPPLLTSPGGLTFEQKVGGGVVRRTIRPALPNVQKPETEPTREFLPREAKRLVPITRYAEMGPSTPQATTHNEPWIPPLRRTDESLQPPTTTPERVEPTTPPPQPPTEQRCSTPYPARVPRPDLQRPLATQPQLPGLLDDTERAPLASAEEPLPAADDTLPAQPTVPPPDQLPPREEQVAGSFGEELDIPFVEDDVPVADSPEIRQSSRAVRPPDRLVYTDLGHSESVAHNLAAVGPADGTLENWPGELYYVCCSDTMSDNDSPESPLMLRPTSRKVHADNRALARRTRSPSSPPTWIMEGADMRFLLMAPEPAEDWCQVFSCRVTDPQGVIGREVTSVCLQANRVAAASGLDMAPGATMVPWLTHEFLRVIYTFAGPVVLHVDWQGSSGILRTPQEVLHQLQSMTQAKTRWIGGSLRELLPVLLRLWTMCYRASSAPPREWWWWIGSSSRELLPVLLRLWAMFCRTSSAPPREWWWWIGGKTWQCCC